MALTTPPTSRTAARKALRSSGLTRKSVQATTGLSKKKAGSLYRQTVANLAGTKKVGPAQTKDLRRALMKGVRSSEGPGVGGKTGRPKTSSSGTGAYSGKPPVLTSGTGSAGRVMNPKANLRKARQTYRKSRVKP